MYYSIHPVCRPGDELGTMFPFRNRGYRPQAASAFYYKGARLEEHETLPVTLNLDLLTQRFKRRCVAMFMTSFNFDTKSGQSLTTVQVTGMRRNGLL